MGSRGFSPTPVGLFSIENQRACVLHGKGHNGFGPGGREDGALHNDLEVARSPGRSRAGVLCWRRLFRRRIGAYFRTGGCIERARGGEGLGHRDRGAFCGLVVWVVTAREPGRRSRRFGSKGDPKISLLRSSLFERGLGKDGVARPERRRRTAIETPGLIEGALQIYLPLKRLGCQTACFAGSDAL